MIQRPNPQPTPDFGIINLSSVKSQISVNQEMQLQLQLSLCISPVHAELLLTQGPLRLGKSYLFRTYTSNSLCHAYAFFSLG